MRPYWSRMGPQPNMTGALIRRWSCQNRDAQGECLVKTKVETRAKQLQAQEYHGLLAIHQKWERGKKGLSCSVQREHDPANSLNSDSGLQNGETVQFCCFNHPVCGSLS